MSPPLLSAGAAHTASFRQPVPSTLLVWVSGSKFLLVRYLLVLLFFSTAVTSKPEELNTPEVGYVDY